MVSSPKIAYGQRHRNNIVVHDLDSDDPGALFLSLAFWFDSASAGFSPQEIHVCRTDFWKVQGNQ